VRRSDVARSDNVVRVRLAVADEAEYQHAQPRRVPAVQDPKRLLVATHELANEKTIRLVGCRQARLHMV